MAARVGAMRGTEGKDPVGTLSNKVVKAKVEKVAGPRVRPGRVQFWNRLEGGILKVLEKVALTSRWPGQPEGSQQGWCRPRLASRAQSLLPELTLASSLSVPSR